MQKAYEGNYLMEQNRITEWLKKNGYVIERLPSDLSRYESVPIEDPLRLAGNILEELAGYRLKRDFFVHGDALYFRRNEEPQTATSSTFKQDNFTQIYQRFKFKRNEKKISELYDILLQTYFSDKDRSELGKVLSSSREDVAQYLIQRGLKAHDTPYKRSK